MRALVALSVLLSGCFSEDWIVTDRRGVGPTTFFGLVKTAKGEELTFVSFFLSPPSRSQFNVSSGIPVGHELKDLEVTAWTDADGTRDCGFECQPLPGDTVITLSRQNWPYVFEIVFDRP